MKQRRFWWLHKLFKTETYKLALVIENDRRLAMARMIELLNKPLRKDMQLWSRLSGKESFNEK